jgi:hypothetical protein
MRGEGGSCGVSDNEYSCTLHRSPNKLWRSYSIFNLCCTSSSSSCNLIVIIYCTPPPPPPPQEIYLQYTAEYNHKIYAPCTCNLLCPKLLQCAAGRGGEGGSRKVLEINVRKFCVSLCRLRCETYTSSFPPQKETSKKRRGLSQPTKSSDTSVVKRRDFLLSLYDLYLHRFCLQKLDRYHFVLEFKQSLVCFATRKNALC